MFKLSIFLVSLIVLVAPVDADKPKALRRLQTAAPVAVPIAVVAPVASPTTAGSASSSKSSKSSSKSSKRQLVHYNTPYEA